MEWWHVYLFTRLDGMNGLCGVLASVIGITAIAVLCVAPVAMDLVKDRHMAIIKLWGKVVAAIFTMSLVGYLAIPTQKEAAAIYLLPKLAKSDFAKQAGQIPTDAAKLMRLKLESWIADMESPKK